MFLLLLLAFLALFLLLMLFGFGLILRRRSFVLRFDPRGGRFPLVRPGCFFGPATFFARSRIGGW